MRFEPPGGVPGTGLFAGGWTWLADRKVPGKKTGTENGAG